MGLAKVFSNSFETNDTGSDGLVTHYYHNTYEEAKNAVITIAKSMRFKVKYIEDTFQEILIEMPKGELIVTLFNQTPSVTSIDFKITTAYLIPMGRGIKTIHSYYEELNKLLSLKNVGGAKGGY